MTINNYIHMTIDNYIYKGEYPKNNLILKKKISLPQINILNKIQYGGTL
jgi:hypothetical protein